MTAPRFGDSLIRWAFVAGAPPALPPRWSSRLPGDLLRLAAFGSCILLSSGASWGQGEEASVGRERTADRVHGYVEGAVERLARRFDSFFGGEVAYEEATGSYLQVGGSTVWREGGEWDFDHRILIKVVLPQTQRRFRLVLESDQEPEPAGGTPTVDPPPVPGEPSDGNRTLLGVESQLRETLNWKVSLTGGIKFPLPADPFVRLRGRWRMSAWSWHFRATETVFWFRSNGFGETTALDLDRHLSPAVLFRASSEATFLLDDSNFDLIQSLNLYHDLSRRDGLTYRYALYGETRPVTRTTAHVVSLRYRRQIYRDWLFFEVEPGVRYDREDHFGPSPYFAIKVDAIARGG